MGTILLIAIIIGVIFLLIFFLSAFITKRRIVKRFRQNNVIVFGKKGSGKDLIFQAIINARKTQYYGNISYGGEYTPINAKDFSLAPNTYNEFIKGEIKKVDKKYKENADWYFSDGGIILPSQYDSTLHKLYPSFPIFYALSRHTYNANVHINTQNIERIWKALREQADYYIKAVKCYKLPFMLVVKIREFERYQSALEDIRPIKKRWFNKFAKGTQDQYQASKGEINEGYIIIWKRGIKYDTRAYHNKIFGYNAPKQIKLIDKAKALFKKKQKKKAD